VTPRRAAFLDRDGVVNRERGYVSRIADFDFVPGVLPAARALRERGFALVIVTNQSGIGRGLYGPGEYKTLTDWMRGEFAAAGAPIAGVYHCPHHPTEAVGGYRRDCDCRKPAPGMLLTAARELQLDLKQAVLFGDRASDLQAAQAAGVPVRVLLGTDGATEPAWPATAGLATSCYASLAHAMADAEFVAALEAA
jgi:D-glycero-D-manno-heptose 1,7-bisphosphate phosphatase